jgi:hypothetical protein
MLICNAAAVCAKGAGGGREGAKSRRPLTLTEPNACCAAHSHRTLDVAQGRQRPLLLQCGGLGGRCGNVRYGALGRRHRGVRFKGALSRADAVLGSPQLGDLIAGGPNGDPGVNRLDTGQVGGVKAVVQYPGPPGPIPR